MIKDNEKLVQMINHYVGIIRRHHIYDKQTCRNLVICITSIMNNGKDINQPSKLIQWNASLYCPQH